MPISILIVGTTLTFMVILYLGMLSRSGSVETVSDVNRGLNIVRDDISQGTGASDTLSSGITDSYGPPTGGSWAGNATTLITKMPATTANRQSPDRTIVRVNQNGCDAANILSNPPYIYNTVHYIYQGNLYRRTLVNQSPPSLCGTPIQQTTCPTYQTTTGCQKDALIATNVSSFGVRYEVPASGRHPNTYCASPNTTRSSYEDDTGLCIASGGPSAAMVVTVLLEETRTVNGKPYTYGHRFSIRPLNAEVR